MNHARTVNSWFLTGLAISLLVLGVAVYSVHAFQIKRNAGVFKRQAEQAEQEHRYDEASRYYRLYLGYVPHDHEARIAWARTLEKKAGRSFRDYQRIFELYETALRQEPGDQDVRRKLIDIAIALKRYRDAMEHIELLLLRGPMRDDGPLEQPFALCFARTNQYDKAVDYYRKAIKHADRHLPSYGQLADLYLDRGKMKDADDVMLALVQNNQDNYEAHLARARYLLHRHQDPKQ